MAIPGLPKTMTPATLAARDSAAVFLLEGRTHIEVTGADRATFLNGFCTNNIKSLSPGQGCEAFFCNVKGHVLAHATVFIGDQSIWIETVPGAAPGLIAHLDRYIIREDVQLHDRTHKLLDLHIMGPRAAEVATFGAAPATLESLPVLGLLLDSGTRWVHSVNWFGGRSYVISGDAVELRPLHGALHISDQLAGKVPGIVSGVAVGTIADWESLRIDAGFPTYGVDITEENLPQEAARDARCISYTKGCYLGQEPVARLHSMGHTNRELRRLIGDSTSIPANGVELIDPATQQPAGHITSAAANPFGDGVVAIGMVKRNWLAAGTRLQSPQGDFVVR